MSVDARASGAEAPGSATSLRLANQRRVLSALLANGGKTLTQSDLTRETGLASGTVSSIVRELAAKDIVTTVPGSGRRGTTVRLGRGAGLAAGIDFGHSHLAVVLGDMSGEVVGEARERIEADLTHEAGLQLAGELLDRLLGGNGADSFRRTHDRHGAARADHRTMSTCPPRSCPRGWASTRARPRPRRWADRARRERCEPRGTRRASPRPGPRARQRGLREGLLRGRCRADHPRRDLPRHRRHGRGDRPPHPGRPGAPVPVREPRLPGGVRRDGSRADDDGRAAARRQIDDIIEAAKAGNVSALRVFEDAGLHLGVGAGSRHQPVQPRRDPGRRRHVARGRPDPGLRPARAAPARALGAAAATPVLVASLGDRASAIGALELAIEATDLSRTRIAAPQPPSSPYGAPEQTVSRRARSPPFRHVWFARGGLRRARRRTPPARTRFSPIRPCAAPVGAQHAERAGRSS